MNGQNEKKTLIEVGNKRVCTDCGREFPGLFVAQRFPSQHTCNGTRTVPVTTAAPEGFEWYCGPGAIGGRQLIEVGKVEALRKSGHSWCDIGSGNHDY